MTVDPATARRTLLRNQARLLSSRRTSEKYRHDGGINHLAAARNVALRLQMLAKALEQLLNQTGLRKRLSEQPQRRAVRNAVLDAEPQKPRERQPGQRNRIDHGTRRALGVRCGCGPPETK